MVIDSLFSEWKAHELPCGVGGDRLTLFEMPQNAGWWRDMCTIKMGEVDDEVKEVVCIQGISTSVVTLERELDVPLAPTKGNAGKGKNAKKGQS